MSIDSIIQFYNHLPTPGKIVVTIGIVFIAFSLFKKLAKLALTIIFIVALILWLL